MKSLYQAGICMPSKKFLILIALLYINYTASYDIIASGVRYTHLKTDDPPQSIHLLVADPKRVHIKIGMAHNKCASAEKLTNITKEYNAIAAINAGYFDFGCRTKIQDLVTKILDCLGYSSYKAFPVFTLKVDNHYFSLSHRFTGVVGWNQKDQKPLYSAIQTDIRLTINNRHYPVHELNKPHPKGPTLYSDCYDTKSPFYHEETTEIVIEDNKIIKIYTNSKGKKKIPKKGSIYALPKTYEKLGRWVKIGDKVSIQVRHIHKKGFVSHRHIKAWHTMDTILAGTPLLIYRSQIVSSLKDSPAEFYTKKQPRTAVGLLPNGNWVFVVIDGRQKHSKGFTLLELAHFMKKLGCTGALNLDGGGSSTMVIQDSIVNSPSGREPGLVRKERPISNALLICSK